MSAEVREWVNIRRSVKGPAVVTVTVMQGNASAKCSVLGVGLREPIKNAVRAARAQALADVKELAEAMEE